MVEIYCKLIINKRRMLDTIPSGFHAAVIERLKELGYDINGDKLKADNK